MATPLATAFVRIRPDTSTFKKDTAAGIAAAGKGISKEGQKHGRIFGATFARATVGPIRGVVGAVGGPLAAGFAAIAGIKVFSGFISDARESARISRITAQAIRSTGGAANITAKQVGNLATAISNQTGKDDEAIQAGQNLLLTFTNIRNETGRGNDIFNQASAAIVDMTAALNNGEVTASGMKSASIQLGKALNDPIKGVSALQRVGVSFTAKQKEQIKTLVESGRTLDAQKIILRELGKEFGGAAKASADPMERLRVIVGNLGERLGTALLPILDKIAKFLGNTVVPAITALIDGFKGTRTAGGKLIEIASTLGLGIRALGNAFRGEGVTSDGFVGVMERLGIALRAVADFISTKVIPAVRGLAEWISRNKEIIPALGIGIAVVLVPAFIAWAAAAGAAAIATIAAAAPVVAVGAAVTLVAFLIIKNWDKIKAATIAVWNALKNAVVGAAQAVLGFLKRNWPLIVAILAGPIGAAVVLIVRNWDKIKRAATAVYTWVRDKFNAIVSFIRGLPGKISSAASGMWDGIKNAFRSAINFIISGWNRLGIPGFSVNINIPGPVPDVHFSWSGLSLPDIPLLDQGGWLPPGISMVRNNTGSPERVLSPREMIGNTYNINVSVPPNANQHEIGRTIVESIKAFEKGSGAGWRR